MNDNLIGSNKSNVKKTGLPGLDYMYIKAGINWVLNQIKIVSTS